MPGRGKRKSSALSTRGGFTTSPFMKKVGSVVTAKDVAQFVKYAAGSSPRAQKFVEESMRNISKAQAGVRVADKVIDIVKEGFGDEPGKEVIAETSTTVTGSSNLSSTLGKKYKTKFFVGQRPTKAVVDAGKQNGTTKQDYNDTMTVSDPVIRAALTLKTGFNQKLFAAYNSRSYWEFAKMEELVDAASFERMTGGFQRAYWLTKHFGVKYRMLNRNKYLKMKVKVHFVRQLKVGFSPLEWFQDCFNTTLPTVGDTNKLSIPFNTQLTPRIDEVSGTVSSCGVDPYRGSITKARIFGDAFEVQKSFSRTLDPGEVWEIDYRHFTGPGMRLDNIITSDATGTTADSAAVFYYPIFEIVGPQVECYDSEDGDEAYIGTSSGAIQLEMKRYFEIVQAPTNPNDVYDPTDGYQSTKWAYRVYTSDTTSTGTSSPVRIFNVDYGDILRGGGSAAPGKYIIPVTTDQSVVRGGKTGQPTGA